LLRRRVDMVAMIRQIRDPAVGTRNGFFRHDERGFGLTNNDPNAGHEFEIFRSRGKCRDARQKVRALETRPFLDGFHGPLQTQVHFR
jgi:hypothetical protein